LLEEKTETGKLKADPPSQRLWRGGEAENGKLKEEVETLSC
jgi:hypothetical protein